MFAVFDGTIHFMVLLAPAHFGFAFVFVFVFLVVFVFFLFSFLFSFVVVQYLLIDLLCSHFFGSAAQWQTQLTTEQKTPGSNHGTVGSHFVPRQNSKANSPFISTVSRSRTLDLALSFSNYLCHNVYETTSTWLTTNTTVLVFVGISYKFSNWQFLWIKWY